MAHFSQKIKDRVAAADDSLVAVRLGKICIAELIPFHVIGDRLKVSRATIYAWCTGKSKPIPALEEKLLELEKRLQEEINK